jgi:hypothetical protein
VSNQQAINNLSQDAQLKAIQATRSRERVVFQKRLTIVTGEE